MYEIFILINLFIRLIGNVNTVSIDNFNLTHLDILYFKHNKRHKYLENNIKSIAYVNTKEYIFNFKKLHIGNFNDPKYRPSINEYNSSHISLKLTPNDIIFHNKRNNKNFKWKDQEKFKGRSGFINSPNNPSKFSDLRINSVHDNTNVKDSDPPKWMFRGKEKITEKLSEYETLMSEIEELSKSKHKSDKDLYSFIKKNLKESTIDPNRKLTVQEVLRVFENQSVGEDLQEREWINHMRRLRNKMHIKFEGMDKIPKLVDPMKFNLEVKAKEDKCGFRYPIEGSPEEIYNDPEIYKFWSGTPLSVCQSTHDTEISRGKLDQSDLELEDLITSSYRRHEKPLSEALKSLRECRIKSNMDFLLKPSKETTESKTLGTDDSTLSSKDIGESQRYRNLQFENYYESFKKDFLGSESISQDRVLRILNPYNPWDEYIKMRNLKSALPPLSLNYKTDLNDLKVSFRTRESVPEQEINQFLREYLHYFLVLESDEALFHEFRNAKFLYDILKYFDIQDQIPVKVEKEYMDLADRFFKIYFPEECPDGFPKRPPDPEFPLTIQKEGGLMDLSDRLTGRNMSYHRVNIYCCLMALARCHPLVLQYTSDIFSEQRIKQILDTLETGLNLELKRIEYGISEIEINNIKYRSICKIDGEFLSSLTDVLVQWNIRKGVENILDLALLITLKRLDNMSPKCLINIISNISYLTTLPETVYINFLSKVVDFVHRKLKYTMINREEYMTLNEALDFLTVICNYEKVVTRGFMESFLAVYSDSILNLGISLGTDEENASMERRIQVYSLISCLQLSGMGQYIHLVQQLAKPFVKEDMELNSIASLSILRSFTDHHHFQSIVIKRTKNRFVRTKYEMDSYLLLKVLESFTRGVKEGRLFPDSYFFFNMMKKFCFIKEPSAEELVESARLTDEFAPYLNKKQITEIYKDLTDTPVYFNFLTRIGMQGEMLDYPLSTIAKVLYYSSKNNVIIEKNWKSFYEMIDIFKHILSIDDIILILDALIMSNFTKVDKLLDILSKRTCNLIEVTDVSSEKVFEIMDKCLKLDYLPIFLLRFYMYVNMFELQGSDHVNSLLTENKDYEVDFRGWKRPISLEKHTESVWLHENVIADVEMDGSRPHVPDNLKYSMRPPVQKPRSYRNVARKELDRNVLASLAKFVENISDDHQFSERDLRLMDSLKRLTSNGEYNNKI